MKFQDLVSRNVAYHKQLNPEAWEGKQLRPEVQQTLLKIAEQFVNYLDIPNFEILDIVLTGSMANYNYTKFSDYDLHVITRYSDLECDDLAEAFYRAKKTLWNNEHDIRIRGNEVELYVEDVEEPPVSAGVYSILNNRWLKQPSYDPPEIDDRAVNLKVRDLIKQIEVAVAESDDPEDLTRIKEKLRRMRRSGLDTGGEYSVENIAFKILRNMGYLDLINRTYTKQQDQNLSLG
jgi:predicted nucleotidyltransferase